MCPFYVKDDTGNLIGPHETADGAISEAISRLVIDAAEARKRLVEEGGKPKPKPKPRPKPGTDKEKTGDGRKPKK